MGVLNSTLRHFDSNGALINEFNYTLHATGRRTQIDELSGRSVINGYDELYRLTSETIVDPINGDYSASYTYDNVGNRTYSTINGVSTSFSYDNNDCITVQGDITYEYDDNGNTLFKGNLEEQTFYRYSLKNKLTQVESAGGINDYEYDVDNNRVEKTEAGTAVRFIVDNNQAYAQVIAEASDTNVIGKEYVYGDDLISQRANASSHYFMYDGLGSTRSLTDDSGSISDQYFYDAFGITLASVGSTDNNYRYTGEQYDAGLDNYYLRARYYDPNIGRFTQMDTWMGRNHDPITLHKYLYANADPVNGIDPSGYATISSMSAAQNIQSTLLNMTNRVGFLVRAYNRVESLATFVDLIKSVNQVFGGMGSVGNSRNMGVALFRSGIPSLNYSEILENMSYNIPKAILAGSYDWGKGFATTWNRDNTSLKGFLVYMPLLSSGTGGSFAVPTPAKVTFKNKKYPVKIVFGAKPGAYGSIFGIGIEMPRKRQLIRMDYHKFREGHKGKGEIAFWKSGDFHYHVNKWSKN
ncbi:RHS repeat domain-containing protein [Pleionea litopenaei]|uniref:RHS repeat-associated core domain-containing protein n=1 Tax=Pleionea litopenaei TaxID=3070815 RepID=A0AA51RWU2_9GAMM|nr:RHS repeat-associated core domain-containing protein [Pleionea sp. HL-JVS1]WMS88919.1 RHS repeat-associated core domain-containing protein [Pleionea sp. HL-JVS1]